MLAAQERPVIHFVRADEALGPKQWKHTYRFFILTPTGLYNISGAITACFGVNVNDRSQAFTINGLSAEEDLKSFTDAVQKFTGLPVMLEDLILSAKEILEFSWTDSATKFLPENTEYSVEQNNNALPYTRR
jgi:hypothetical protein